MKVILYYLAGELVMEIMNRTLWTEFILLGLLTHTVTHTVFFGVILLIFFVALLGNSLFFFVIIMGSYSRAPMYFFLSQLSFIDICQTSSIVPKMSMDFWNKGNTISLAGCGTQIFLTFMMGGAECLLLAVMSYDRYVAICKPLHYPVLMNRKVCVTMSGGVWFGAVFHSLVHTFCVLQLPFCESNRVNQFFCTVQALLKLSCSETSTYENLFFLTGSILLLAPFSIILASYIAILLTVLGMQSVEGKHKAFGTCLSHLCVVGLFYGAASFKYMRPRSYRTPEQDKVASLFCDIVTPMLNPLIYSLRNRDVLVELRKHILKCKLHI
ncbi:olfactory receptor 2V1-like [Crotalus tigris]|uniref:olfactory receptor 2V1-like n=1 Tax=Crotalus tigris TaxID=88082 RepID=UPI00192FA466|nr:olfactory receptor 2V1-like [Crotalus tigris]